MTVWPRSCVWISFSSISLLLDKAVSWLWHQTLLFCRPKDKAQFSPFPFPPQVFSYLLYHSFLSSSEKNLKIFFLLVFDFFPHFLSWTHSDQVSTSIVILRVINDLHVTKAKSSSYLAPWQPFDTADPWNISFNLASKTLSWNFHLFLLASSQPLLGFSSFLWSSNSRLMKYIDVICPHRDKPHGGRDFFSCFVHCCSPNT